MDKHSALRPIEDKTGEDPIDSAIASDALLKEYEFVESLIPLYRKFQMDTVRYGLLVYTALLTLITIRSSAELLQRVLETTAALAPYPIALLLLIFATTEVRIKRASRHIQERIAPVLQKLSGERGVLTWEYCPGRSLNTFEKVLSSSGSLILTMSIPAVCSASWYLLANTSEVPIADLWVVVGLVFLIMTGSCAFMISGRHESRSEKS